jgi:hypothetical protein
MNFNDRLTLRDAARDRDWAVRRQTTPVGRISINGLKEIDKIGDWLTIVLF